MLSLFCLRIISSRKSCPSLVWIASEVAHVGGGHLCDAPPQRLYQYEPCLLIDRLIDWLMDGWMDGLIDWLIDWLIDCPTDRAATRNRRSIVRRCVVEHRSSSVFWKKRSLDSCNSFTVFALMNVFTTCVQHCNLEYQKDNKGSLDIRILICQLQIVQCFLPFSSFAFQLDLLIFFAWEKGARRRMHPGYRISMHTCGSTVCQQLLTIVSTASALNDAKIPIDVLDDQGNTPLRLGSRLYTPWCSNELPHSRDFNTTSFSLESTCSILMDFVGSHVMW